MIFQNTNLREISMRRTLLLLLLASSVVICSAPASAQQFPGKGYTTVIPLHARPASTSSSARVEIVAPPRPIPQWGYSVLGYDGNTYTGSVVGLSPLAHAKGTTNIAVQIVPLVITITDGSGTFVYDPTAPDPPAAGHTDVDVAVGSPVFTNNNYTMNGVNVGNTQYIDAFQRGEFWSSVGGTPYHLMFNQSTLPPQALSFGIGGANGSLGNNYTPGQTGGCEEIGVVETTELDNAIGALMAGPLAPLVNVGTLPVFITRNVVSAFVGKGCCILGYHSANPVGPNIQIYGVVDVDTAGFFTGYTVVLAHEMGEAINDPTGGNPTPPWGNIGQVSGCQGNFEVGDPLTGISNDFVINGSNGLVYHLQELAFFNWFFGGTPQGAGGKFSDNGSFGAHAQPCPAPPT